MSRSRRDLTAMLRPRSIALVGATDRSRWSQNTFDNLVNRKYAGDIHLVSRRGGTVHGRSAATSCAAVGAPIDLALLMVPMAAIDEALADLAAADVHNAVILTSGFAETGHEGADHQSRLALLARRHGVSLLGPNCLGFVNFIDNVPLWTGGFRAPSRPGSIAVVTQSGANGSFISSLAAQHEIGLSHMVSTGNEADLDCAAFIDHLVEQPEVRAIALFAETIRHAPSFAAAARRAIAAAKPIVVLKIGLSEVTARSAQAHTGALVGDDRVFDGVCRQLGIVRVDAIEDLLFTADVITRTGVLEPRGLAVVSISGGACEIVADRAQVLNVPMPALSDSAVAELHAALPSFGTPHNPLDITGGAVLQPDLFEQGLRILGRQQEFSALACLFDVPVAEEHATEFVLAALRHIAAGLHAAGMPALLVSHSVKPVTGVSTRIIDDIGLPYVSAGLHHGMNALGKAFWWSEQQRRLGGASASIATIADADDRPRSERATLDYLARCNVPVVPVALAQDADQAVALARATGGRVALKIASDDIAHKSDIGGVVLNLQGDDAVADAFRRVMAAAPHGARVDGVLVAPMRSGGLELFVGCTRDPQWGPVMAVGLGGVWVEVLQDVSLRPLPIDATEVKRMLGELRGAKL
ncbi:MAG TPA: acetate--CoA ligase family protein, partial [Acetobacteraceae bacterium]|nr:acetate--CoA ligase family protein [Acetobacteraceae bacterium]